MRPGQGVVVAAAVDPAVAAHRGPAQRRLGVAADEERQRPARDRALLDAGDVVDLAVVLEPVAGEQAADDVHALVGPLAPPLERHVAHLVVLRPRAGADAQREPVVR